ncbi:MAG: hypothetical protein M3Z97_07685 [Candidatus Dormibacteraeota bacterium]|nr:hypothetical protein [Candidatus Dormibacteraeota bacterium]
MFAVIFLHGFGVRYDLPISLALYLYAAAGVVVVSFVMVAIFAGNRTGQAAVTYPRRPAPWLLALGRSRVVRIITGALGLLALLTIIVTGLFGSTDPLRNPSEYLTWVYFWAGMVILSGLVGNLWTLFNPWTALYDLVTAGRPREPLARLPEGLGVWPAVAVYLAFAVFELASGVANQPRIVGILALTYTALTLAGMTVFGRDRWLRHFEAFTVLFDIVGRFGPVETERDDSGRLRAVWLRPWGTGLLQPVRAGWDMVAFVILMLSSLAFDGITAPTPAWTAFVSALQPWSAALGALGPPVVKGLGLVLLSAGFFLIFVAVARLMLYLGSSSGNELEAVTAFALTLVPIALVYNAAHNYSYLTIQAQGLFPLLGDPLARGWHLLPTSGYQVSFALAGAATVWYVQVVLIVLGHVIAVYLAHLRAGERFKTAQQVLLSQYPMLVLMVVYTMTSLWILAQPITREG